MATLHGFSAPCPRCGEDEGTIYLNLADGRTLRCNDCDGEFDADDVKDLIGRWRPVLEWIDTIPARP